jgi:hypothetical protein
MGAKMTKVMSPHGFAGVQLDSAGHFHGVITTGGAVMLYDCMADKPIDPTTTNILVTPGEFIRAVYLRGAADLLSIGTMTFVDTKGCSFTCKCQVKTHGFRGVESEYVSFFEAPLDSVITSMGILWDKEGLTVLTDRQASPRPTLVDMSLDGAGAVGWLEDEKDGQVGLVADGGVWKGFAERVPLNSHHVQAKYFEAGHLLSGMTCIRSGDSSTIQMFTTNAEGAALEYTSWQKNVSAMDSTFTYVSEPGQVIDRLQYLTVSGVNTIRDDFLWVATASVDYSAPDDRSYGSAAEAIDPNTNSLWSKSWTSPKRNGETTSTSSKIWFAVGSLLGLALLITLIVWVVRRFQRRAQAKNEHVRAEGESMQSEDTVFRTRHGRRGSRTLFGTDTTGL